MSPVGSADPWDAQRQLMIAGDALTVAVPSGGSGAAVGAVLAASLVSAPGVRGVGIDVVAVERFAAALHRTPALAPRLFAAAERVTGSGHPRSPASLAARFAVKEAVAKALGVPAGMDWHDCSVLSESSGRPVLRVTGTVASAALALGITDWRISLSHDAGIAAAIVVGLG